MSTIATSTNSYTAKKETWNDAIFYSIFILPVILFILEFIIFLDFIMEIGCGVALLFFVWKLNLREYVSLRKFGI